MDLVEKIRQGDVRSISRFISLVERRDPVALQAIKEIYGSCGRARLVGITGPPGVGKSCLVSALVKSLRREGKTVGVLAVDPTSPFTGGALLGDRARMIELSGDRGVFIRSLASRGSMGGLSAAVNDAADVLDFSGKDVIIVETVGVGQGEIDIAGLAHTVVLALMPGYGDTLQAMKAGIMEIADIFVINKADKPGADETAAELANVQNFHRQAGGKRKWVIPVVRTVAIKEEGIEELANAIHNHFRYLEEEGLVAAKNRDRRTRQFLDLLTQRIRSEFIEVLKTDEALQHWVDKIGNLGLDPYTASEQVIDMIKEAREQKRQ